jgi:carbamoyltransferase
LPLIVLGLNAFHGDSAAALTVDGDLVAAVEEERFTRIKHWAGVPAQAVQYCLKEHGITLRDVDAIAINQDSGANFWRKIGFSLKQRPSPALFLEKLKTRSERRNIVELLAESLGDSGFVGSYMPVEHHQAHLASAFYASPYDEAAVLSIDGFGDFASTAWGYGSKNSLSMDERVFFPHSMGTFYQALTQFLGFPHYGDEYKVMGLAPYGEPTYLKKLRELVAPVGDGFRLNLEYFRHHRKNIGFEWRGGTPVFDRLYSGALEQLLGPARLADEHLEQKHYDLARSVQVLFEEILFHLLARLHSRHNVPTLALAGGCAMNSVANGKIRAHSKFESIYVQAAAGDAGGAIGAAYCAGLTLGGQRGTPMTHAYWGPSFSTAEIHSAVEVRRADLVDCDIAEVTDEAELLANVAASIAKGQVVGWFQGRLEWGPRALGHRSILGDPRRSDMKAILNEKIKRRESFRPFAPSVLAHRVPEWFDTDDAVPFMMKVYPIREEKRALIPAVTHVDGSGRLQTVTERDNDRYFQLITAFESLTGVPMLLNTSFNENEPIVCRPEEALDCFLRTQMDWLVLGNTVITRRESGQ